jgi:hypothetical protein
MPASERIIERTFPIARGAPYPLRSVQTASGGSVVAAARPPVALVAIPGNGGTVRVAPALVPYVQRLRAAARARGAKFQVTSGYRSPGEQRELYMRWQAGDPAVISQPVSNSLHLLGLAVDIESDQLGWLGGYAESIGMRWGGRFRDPVHFDLGRR